VSATFSTGAFFIYLGSGHPIIEETYGHDDWFAVIFMGIALCIGAAVLLSERFIRRYGARSVSLTTLLIMFAVAVMYLGVALATDGAPPFAVWVLIIAALGSSSTVTTPTVSALAMQPMSKIAGTASGVWGVVTIGGGSLLAAVFDSRFDGTVTPMAIGCFSLTGIAVLIHLWARGGSLDEVDPDQQ
jgi:DHA1 family bicyclomycin/chloramphenicol resistance-like MFS transporter